MAEYLVHSSASTARLFPSVAHTDHKLSRRSFNMIRAASSAAATSTSGATVSRQRTSGKRSHEPASFPESSSNRRSKDSNLRDVTPQEDIWFHIRSEARVTAEEEPILASYLYSTILSHLSLDRSIATHLANKLGSDTLLSSQLYTIMADVIARDPDIMDGIQADLKAVRQRDPACESFLHCMLNFKGFLAIQTHRVAHRLWRNGRHSLALALQSRASEVFQVDIHPAARLGKGVMFDHGTGIVVGETAVIGNNVSILHGVTLGGTGKAEGDRHPKVRDGVLIGAGASILGNIEIGEGAKIGAGSIVLKNVPAMATAVGNPARLLEPKGGKAVVGSSGAELASSSMDHTSFALWSNYVI